VRTAVVLVLSVATGEPLFHPAQISLFTIIPVVGSCWVGMQGRGSERISLRCGYRPHPFVTTPFSRTSAAAV
jgi:hypothetical protein